MLFLYQLVSLFCTCIEADLRQLSLFFLKQSWVLYLVIKEDMNQEEKITYGLNRWFWSLMKDGDGRSYCSLSVIKGGLQE